MTRGELLYCCLQHNEQLGAIRIGDSDAMPIEIVGANEGREREAAETLRVLLNPLVGATNQLLIVVGPQCLGETVQDIDLLLLGTFGRGIKFKGSYGDAHGQDVRLVNLCLIIEVKDHSAPQVQFDSQHVKVRYAGETYWKNVTSQVLGQKLSLRNFLKRHGQPAPWIEALIWLRNYDGYIPPAAANVLGSNPTAGDFLRAIERVRQPQRNEQDFHIVFTTNRNVSAIQSASSFFHQKIVPTPLDRRRLELICRNLISDQKYAERLGEQLLIFRGRGGSGKTIHLLRLGKNLYDNGVRVLFLTYNKSLVSDIRRLLVILGMSERGDDRGISISTAHSFFVKILSAWGLWQAGPKEETRFPEERYAKSKSELIQLIANETLESLSGETVVQNAPEAFAWDYILIDEAQDWPDDERDILYRIFGTNRCIVADGIDQLIRSGSRCDWSAPLSNRERQIVPLRRAMRMKSNLCRFIRAFAEESGGEWDQEVNDEIPGGTITIIDGSYTLEYYSEIFQAHSAYGNQPIDALFCVPSDTMMQAPILSERLHGWGYAVWDGTSSDIRDTFPTTVEEHRIVRYESCRGLEGWTVICIGLDRHFQHYDQQRTISHGVSLFDTPADFARREATARTLIPLTRAIDHLVIQLDGPSELVRICRRLADMYPEFVTWRVSQ